MKLMIIKLCKKHNIITWSFHLPFFPFDVIDISSKNESVRAFAINTMAEQIKKAGSYGFNKFIIHPSAEPYGDEEREEHIIIAAESLRYLSTAAQASGGVLCVENLPRTCLSRCSDDMLKLISLDDNLMVCFDTNHLLMEDPNVFIKKLGSRIVTTHVSDYDFINERHWLPGEGKLDFYRIHKTLSEVGYDDVWLYELSLFQASTDTITRTKPLSLQDLYQNAMEIFEEKPITVYGTPIV